MSSSDQFQRLEKLFHELEDLNAEERGKRLVEVAESDPALYPELLQMLSDSTHVSEGEQLIDRLSDAAEIIGKPARDPDRIGPYQLQKLIGEGGMGRVYLAEQTEPVKRRVALKLTRRGIDSAEAIARFRAERQALAVLEHPNIARVFDAGSTEGGRPWFAMEFIDGIPINRWATDRELSLRQRIELLLPVCEAVQHAHAKGLVHRDLKPSNILVVDDGTIGRPMVIDFGIARLADLSVDDRTQVTRIGELVGTPEYMSPEQASLGEIDIDTRSDIYSLGLVLYELLVGELPLSGQQLRALGFQAMCQAIREGDTPRPSRVETTSIDSHTLTWRSRLKGDLDSVLLKALAKDRDRRYGTAAAFAEDLRRYLANEPVLAQPPSLRYRAGKFMRRHRLPVAAAIIVTFALLASTLIASIALLRTQEALAEAEYQYEMAQANLLGQNTYGDILYELYAEDERGNELTDALMQRWSALHAERDKNPEQAASSSFVLGRQFHLRRDHTNAQKVLGDWLAEGYGPRSLRAMGREYYAMSLFESGKRAEALPVMREVMASFEDGHRRPLQAQLNFALRLATLSRAPADIEKAETLYHARAEEQSGLGMTAVQRVTSLSGYMHILRLKGDLDEMVEVGEEIVATYETAPDHVLGRGLARANLGSFYLYLQDNAAGAEAIARKIIGFDQEAEGESAVTARGYYLLTRALLFQGELDSAENVLATGKSLQEKYTGLARGGPDFDLLEAELAGLRGDLGRAQAALTRAEESAHPVEYALGQAHFALVAGGNEQEIYETLMQALEPVRPLHGKRKYLIRRLNALGLPKPTKPL
jgi:non-specific serine/threonine protein kinase/serine/threonine-protein kinase